ncbi:PQ-loop domain-containing transporter [Dethiothermospora halolimnae]|uniref:PQ-loop domain-containing transporter n=1 Tax=Dethiothermospora halolimnae TaxID=3114390 RepID=UPI003CCC0ADF
MSIFEIIMLLCFGAAWPFSIYKSYKSKSVEGKSPIFLVILLMGYVAGILHKKIYHYDNVIFLYMLNFLMVSTDLILYIRNSKMSKNQCEKS